MKKLLRLSREFFYLFLFKKIKKSNETQIRFLTAEESHALLEQEKAILVDVREANEVANGMASPALWLPMSEIDFEGANWNQFITSLPKEKIGIFYCTTGKRAQRAASKLDKMGYKTANMGSFTSWADGKFPTTKMKVNVPQ